MARNFIRFTGKYGDLKKHWGFSFQRLMADNYMQWNNDDVRVWKKGGDVTVDGWTNYEFPIFHLLISARKNNTKLPLCGRHILIYAEHTSNKVLDGDAYQTLVDATTTEEEYLVMMRRYFAIYVKPETLLLMTKMMDAGLIADPTEEDVQP